MRNRWAALTQATRPAAPRPPRSTEICGPRRPEELLAEGREHRPGHLSLVVRELAGEPRLQGGQGGRRGPAAPARSEPGDDGEEVPGAVRLRIDGVRRVLGDAPARRDPELRGWREPERRRHHPDHLDRLSVERERPAEHAGVGAEAASPHRLGEHGHPRARRTGVDEATEERPGSKRLEEVRRDQRTLDALRLAIGGEVEPAGADRGQRLEGLGLGLPGKEVCAA